MRPLRLAFVTLFPELIPGPFTASVLARAVNNGLVTYESSNPRDYTTDRHRTVDDSPYGGEPGMLLKAEPVAQAIESLKLGDGACLISTDPAGPLFKQSDASFLATQTEIAFVCGHYEGVDQRALDHFGARAFSIGDYVLTGGELPALVMAEAIVRLLPGVLGNPKSLTVDSFGNGLLSAPNYTRPEVWRGHAIPEIIKSGDHAAVATWRRREALKLTYKNRPELLDLNNLNLSDRNFILELKDRAIFEEFESNPEWNGS